MYNDIVVYCIFLRSVKAAFFEPEKAKFTVATLVLMFTIIINGPYNQSKQSKTFYAKCNLKVIVRKTSLISKSDCVSFTNLNHTVRHICHVVDVCSKLLKVFHDYCLFHMFDQLAVGIVFSCFWLKNYKRIVLRYSMTKRQYFCVEESLI